VRITTMFLRLIFDDDAQDLIEYALLAGLIGVVGVAAWANVGVAIKNAYVGWDVDVQGVSASTPDPIGS
jgi:Flp pilus assembly pilin Flp